MRSSTARCLRVIAAIALTVAPAIAADSADPSIDELISRLAGNPSPYETRLTCEKLAEMGPGAAKAIPALAALVGGPSKENQLLATQTLGYIHTPEAIPALARASRGNDELYYAGMVGLGEVGPPAIDELATLARVGKDPQSVRAIMCLGVVGPEAVSSLQQIHPATASQTIALKNSLQAAQTQGPGKFADAWKKGSPQQRSDLTALMGSLGYHGLSSLLDALSDPDPQLRNDAARGAYTASYFVGEARKLTVPGDPLHNPFMLEQILAKHIEAIRAASKDPNPDTSRNASMMLMELDRVNEKRRLATNLQQQRQLADAPPAASDLADLRSKDTAKREAAIRRVLVKPHGPRAVLAAAVGVKDPAVVAWYRENIDEALVPEAIDAINRGDAQSYEYAVHVIASRFSGLPGPHQPNQDAVKKAAGIIHARFLNAPRRGEASLALVNLGPYASSYVSHDLASGPVAAQQALVNALADWGGTPIEDYSASLRKLVLDSTRAQRPALIRAISKSRGAKEMLDELMHSPNVGLRLSAIDGYMSYLGLTDARALFEPMIDDKDPDIAAAAMTALHVKYALAVREIQKTPGPDTASVSPKALQIPLATLIWIIDSTIQTDAGKQRAVFEIGELGAAGAGAPAVHKLTTIAGNDEADTGLRIEAVTTLGRMGAAAKPSVAALQKIAGASDEKLKAAAAAAVNRISHDVPAPAFKGDEGHRVLAWNPQATTVPESVIEHMKFLVSMADAYRSDHADYPATYNDLRGYFAQPESESACMTNPRTNIAPGFWYVKPKGKSDGSVPLIWESQGGPLVAFSDGSVRACDTKAAPTVVRSTEANLRDLQEAIRLYPYKHNRQPPQRIEQLREMFDDDASWRRVITNPTTGESPGYVFVPSTAKPWESDKLKQQIIVYQASHGTRDSSAPALYADGQVR